jgi:hypothetical protein
MTSKRQPIARYRRPTLTAEMVELFRQGREIQKAGASETWEEEGGRRAEFLDITKRLDIVLLRRGWHEVSVFDDLDGDPPAYMVARDGGTFNGWWTGQELQRELQAALDTIEPTPRGRRRR